MQPLVGRRREIFAKSLKEERRKSPSLLVTHSLSEHELQQATPRKKEVEDTRLLLQSYEISVRLSGYRSPLPTDQCYRFGSI